MSDVVSVTTLFEALGRDPNDLIGVKESDWLDFKSSPYQLNMDRDRWELAKDVSSIANAGIQGLIVLGVETTVGIESIDETAVRLRPIGDGLVHPGQMQDVIRGWVYPRLDVEIRSHPLEGEGLLWTVLVDIQRERDMPFVVVGEFTSERRFNRTAFGIYKRVGSTNVPYQPAQVHQWLHHGWSAELGASDSSMDSGITDQAEAILADDISACGLSDSEEAFYLLQAAPLEKATVSQFYVGALNPLQSRLVRLEPLRQGGFNLPDGQTPERTRWDGLRTSIPGLASLSVSRTGIATAIMGQRYLTWATDQYSRNESWINPLALTEFTLEFWRFYSSETLSRMEDVRRITWRCGIQNAETPPLPLMLPYYRRDFMPFESASPGQSFTTPWVAAPTMDPEQLAFVTLASIYPQFGKDPQLIPFSSDGRIVSEEIAAKR